MVAVEIHQPQSLIGLGKAKLGEQLLAAQETIPGDVAPVELGIQARENLLDNRLACQCRLSQGPGHDDRAAATPACRRRLLLLALQFLLLPPLPFLLATPPVFFLAAASLFILLPLLLGELAVVLVLLPLLLLPPPVLLIGPAALFVLLPLPFLLLPALLLGLQPVCFVLLPLLLPVGFILPPHLIGELPVVFLLLALLFSLLLADGFFLPAAFVLAALLLLLTSPGVIIVGPRQGGKAAGQGQEEDRNRQGFRAAHGITSVISGRYDQQPLRDLVTQPSSLPK